jgi:glycosyltransferase involved in cell wall biosynthesis
MKVLVLAQYFPPDMGGASTRVSNVVKGLLAKDCDVTVVAAFPHYPHGKVPMRYKHKLIVPEKFGRVKVLRVWIPSLPHSNVVNRSILHISFIISSLFALPFVGGFDVIWAASPNFYGFYSALLYRFVKRSPIVRNVDDLWPEVFYELGFARSKAMRWMLDFLTWLSYAVPAVITPISAAYKRRIIEKYKVRAEKIHVVEVGVERVKPLNGDKNAKNRFLVMYSGVLGLGYDFDTVLKAASLLTKYKGIVFMIRGVGELASRIQKHIEELNLANAVLDTHFLPKAKLSDLLRSADVFLLPMSPASFVDEGLPTKVFEYQAYGKPIVCSSEGESARYIEASKSGLVVKPGDPEVFAQAVLKLYKDRKLARELGRNGWNYVSENLTSEKIGKRMYEVFMTARK